jgi:hypothetical protein
MMKLVALDPYGHWNFKPAAADMWAFLSQFRRDLAAGKLDGPTATSTKTRRNEDTKFHESKSSRLRNFASSR